MKTELATVAARDLQIIEYRSQRVVTTEQMAAGYGATEQMITNNFNRNKSRFVEGKHYFKLTGEEVEILRNSFRGVQISNKARSLTLWTERGAANHAKMLETDQAWSYHEDLVEFYFTQRGAITAPAQRELSTMEILQIAMASEQGRLAAEERAKHAELTKSQISRKREASALGKLSAVTRRCRDLEEQLGESAKHATITKVEKATNGKGEFKFAPLRRWCRDNAIEAKDVPDERYGSVKSWPAGAWQAVYGVDLKSLFGEKKIMIIQSKLIRAALVCAAKNDVRYYLNGLHITPKHIEATNGHVALRMEHGIRTRKNIIIQFEGPVPAKAETTELVFNKEAFAIHRDVFERRISITGIKLVDGLFPDMERVIPKKVDFSINPVIQAKYLSYPEKMFGRERKFIPVQLQPSGEHGAVRFQFDPVINTTYGNPEFVVMRCRDNAIKVIGEYLG